MAIIIMAGTMVEAITMDGGGADIEGGAKAANEFPANVTHPHEEKQEPPKDEARKKVIEEYANSLRELIKVMSKRLS